MKLGTHLKLKDAAQSQGTVTDPIDRRRRKVV